MPLFEEIADPQAHNLSLLDLVLLTISYYKVEHLAKENPRTKMEIRTRFLPYSNVPNMRVILIHRKLRESEVR